MKAARLHEIGKGLQVDEIPKPTPGYGEVVVGIEGAGLCHSDIYLVEGLMPVPFELPVTLGHENSGVVAEVGKGVSNVKEGDEVAVYGGWGCGYCEYCTRNMEQLCSSAMFPGLSIMDGGFADYLLVPNEKYLIKLENIECKTAALYTDAALTPYRAVKKSLPYMPAGCTVLLIGFGALGQFGFKILEILTGSEIIVIDTDEKKLRTAKEWGAAHAFNGANFEVLQKVLDVTKGIGVEAVLDFVGSDDTLSFGVGACRSGGKVTQVGLGGGTAKMRVLDTCRFEVQFDVSCWGSLQELYEVLRLVEIGKLTAIDVEYIPLESIDDAYNQLKAGNVQGRIVITP